MPIYEYACKSCQHKLDALQKIADAQLVDCPECGKPQLKRLLSAPKFRLKGQGWYETDFKKDNQRNLANDKSESSKSDSDKSDSDKGSKTETSKTDKADTPKTETAKSDTKVASKPSTDSSASTA